MHLVNERRIIFLNKLHRSNVTLIRILARFVHSEYMSLASKYDISTYVPKYVVKNCVWKSFRDSIN